MATTGKVTEIFDSTAVNKQLKEVSDGLKLVLKDMEKIATAAAKNKDVFGDSKKISEVDAAHKNLTKTKKAASEHNKELNRLLKEEKKLQAQIALGNSKTAKSNVELKIQKQKLNKETQLEAKTNKNLVGAYAALNAKLTQAKTKYLDLAAAGKTNTTEAKRLKTEIKKLDTELQKVKKSTGVFKSGLAGLSNMAKQVGGTLVAAFSIGALKSFFTSALQKWDVQTQAVQKLSAALIANGKDADKLIPRYRRFASHLQRLTTVGDEATLQMMQMAETMGVVDLEQAAKDAIGLSKALNLDLNTSMKMVALAAEGEFTMLNRYVPALRSAKDATEQAAIANKLFADGFKIAMTEAEVGLGAVKQLDNAWGDVMETVGGFVARAVLPLAKGLRDLITPAEDLTKTFEQQMDKVIDLQDNVVPLVDEYKKLEEKTKLSADEQDRMRVVIEQIGEKVPFAITQMDEYGKTIAISTGLVDDYVAAEQSRLKVMNVSEINTIKATQAINEFNISMQETAIRQAQTSAFVSSDELGQLNIDLADMMSQRIGFIEAIKQLEGDFLDDRRNENKKTNEDQSDDTLKEAEKLAQEILDIRKEFGLISAKELSDIEIKAFEDSKAATKFNEEQKGIIRMGIRAKNGEEFIQQIKSLDALEVGLAQRTSDTLVEIKKIELEKKKGILAEWEEASEETRQKIKEQAIELAFTLIDLVNAQFSRQIELLDQGAAADEIEKERQLEAAGDNADKREAIEKSFADKEKQRAAENLKLRQKQAKFNKAVGIIEATINTLVGVTRAFSDPGGFLGVVLAALILITGIATVATIASQPIPSFEKGRKGGKATLAEVGEVGTEGILTKEGQLSLTPGRSTLAFLPEGASVIPHGELLEMAGRATMTEIPRFGAGDSSGFADLKNEMMLNRAGIAQLTEVVKNKREAHISMNKRGIQTALHDGANRIEYINNKFIY